MIYIITESGVNVYNSLNKMKRELTMEKHEMTKLGPDYVCYMTDDSLEVSKDVRLLEQVASKKVFSKDKMDLTNWLQLLTIVIVYFATR